MRSVERRSILRDALAAQIEPIIEPDFHAAPEIGFQGGFPGFQKENSGHSLIMLMHIDQCHH
jgi:hypothetical protein